MAHWKKTIDVSKSWKEFDEDKFEESLANLVTELKTCSEYSEGNAYKILIDDLANKSKNVKDLDVYWDKLYDFCDAHRFWLKTIY